MASREVSFLTFFMMWARVQGWTVPLLHVRICTWLETCTDPERVLMVFRGAAKSTIYAVFKAWTLYRNRAHRSLVWSADNDTAGMLTADTINVLRNHPLCIGMLPRKPGAKRFSVLGSRDARNASMRAVGVTSNATGARADAVDFDDIEVPGNIETPEARLKLRQRISESTHIAVPGAQKTFIGTPHTHDSIYPERIAAGASTLIIPLFAHATRYKQTDSKTRYPIKFTPAEDGLYVVVGIHKHARVLVEGTDYRVDAGDVVFAKPPGAVLDLYSGCAWPERFDRNEIELRRKETRTLNAWDSQYMLEAKPIEEIRLDPERITPYAVEAVIRKANGTAAMFLGSVQIAMASVRWDPASGKLNSDVSAVAVVLQDLIGRRYLHRMERLTGEVAEFDDTGKVITGGQVWQLCDLVEALNLPRVVVETNGIGAFAPAVLKAALKQRRLRCGVAVEQAVANKSRRILEAWEPLLESGGQLWAHVSVLRGPLWDQMKEWIPTAPNQKDDYLDAGAGALTDTPERVGQIVGNPNITARDDWRHSAGEHEVVFER
ncbi:TPA: phage terminase large subunit [Stenotrophomonas maltophilia]|uniref:phage terminase large subunit n=1 Tax=Stenotrophomonas maltophilia TaxID=40324 RepID=UPI0015DDC74D|nr:phage terminase large subunit [Stenotrophomonas maltophilia]MBA0294350.1 transcriptional regulator [Stenotrophomonas maltophilia]MBN4986100.1 phage terminase large subunit [Stenotrophomonas maltophilia]HDS1091592.1 phage terminase large subunit [Stenotrophomonas maltophilia]HEL7675722.1 phage terminase large subunit [Stenotrophomonas maltophilia]